MPQTAERKTPGAPPNGGALIFTENASALCVPLDMLPDEGFDLLFSAYCF